MRQKWVGNLMESAVESRKNRVENLMKSDGNLVREGSVAAAKMGGNLSESGGDSGL